jgi:hypothetical protein
MRLVVLGSNLHARTITSKLLVYVTISKRLRCFVEHVCTNIWSRQPAKPYAPGHANSTDGELEVIGYRPINIFGLIHVKLGK